MGLMKKIYTLRNEGKKNPICYMCGRYIKEPNCRYRCKKGGNGGK